MRNKIYINGCSFSYGDRISEPKLFSWPNQLRSDFEEFRNEAIPGGSNHRAVRRTTEFFSTINDPGSWITILQLTSPERYEYKENFSNHWVGVQNGFTVDDDQSFGKRIAGNAQLDYDQITVSGAQAYIDTLFLVHAYVNYCTARGIKFFITGMSSRCMPLRFARDCSSQKNELGATDADLMNIQSLANSLPMDKFLLPISQIIDQHVQEDLHPNEQGHTLFARYIKSKIQRGNV